MSSELIAAAQLKARHPHAWGQTNDKHLKASLRFSLEIIKGTNGQNDDYKGKSKRSEGRARACPLLISVTQTVYDTYYTINRERIHTFQFGMN